MIDLLGNKASDYNIVKESWIALTILKWSVIVYIIWLANFMIKKFINFMITKSISPEELMTNFEKNKFFLIVTLIFISFIIATLFFFTVSMITWSII